MKEKKNCNGLSEKGAANISALIAMGDGEFARRHLQDLTPEELEEFLQECPQFAGSVPADSAAK